MEPSLDQVIKTLQDLQGRLPDGSASPDRLDLEGLVGVVFWECDEQGCMSRLRGQVEPLLGAPSQAWLGKPLESLWQGEPAAGSPLDWHDQIVSRGGSAPQLWLRLAALNGGRSGYRGVLIDCTTLQPQAADNRKLQEKLARQHLIARQQQAFALLFGREVRTLMHRMLGLLSIIRQRPQPQSLDALQVSLEHLLSLSSPLQDALGPGWSVESQAVAFDPHQTVVEVVTWLQSEARAKVIEVHCAISESIPHRLYGDVVKLRQILLQLLDNAVKYSTGDVIIDVCGDSQIRFCIQDTGPGMSAEKIDSLFRGSLLEGDLPTTGLGIKLARHLVQLLGGQIWVDSNPEQGTSFFFSLTFATDGVDAPVKLVEAEGGRLKVLLAEDDGIAQKVALRLLNSLGHRVDIVSNGLDVLEALQRGTYDVVLLDVEMPGLDGLETARQIHQRFTPLPYLIALTAGNSAADRRKVMLAGIQDFLAKPLRAEELRDALTQIHSHR